MTLPESLEEDPAKEVADRAGRFSERPEDYLPEAITTIGFVYVGIGKIINISSEHLGLLDKPVEYVGVITESMGWAGVAIGALTALTHQGFSRNHR